MFLVMENKINRNLSWETACLIGLGGHAKNKLSPALEAVGINVVGVVSRDPALSIPGAQTFLTVTDAILRLPKATLFIIASPPSAHYLQVKTLIEAERDVFVEKPAFLSLIESAELAGLACERGVVLVEMLMYLENKSAQQIIGELKSEPASVKSIDCQFLIPSIPLGTFRNETSLGNSLLSDMACYPLSLLALAGYELSNLSLIVDTTRIKENTIFCIKGSSRQTNIYIRVGHNGEYRNTLTVEFNDDREISCEPFFYGRNGYRKLIRATRSGERVEHILETNAYERMFLRRRLDWITTQKGRLDALELVSESLERLGRQAGLR